MQGVRLFLVAAAMLLALPSAATAVPSGALTQIGCFSDMGSGCSIGRALDGAQAVAVSGDGAFVYAASKQSDAVTIFYRDPASGALLQTPGTGACIAAATPGCRVGTGLDGADALALSPDGQNVYVASELGDTLAILKRDAANGTLENLAPPLNCIGNTAGACPTKGRALNQPEAVAVSPNGANVYVASAVSDAVAVFSRDPAADGNPGELKQLTGKSGCVSRDGRTGPGTTAQLCNPGTGLRGAEAMALSPGGDHLYVTSLYDDAIAEFVVNPADGSLTHTSDVCVAETSAGDVASCRDVRGIDHPEDVAVSPDGRHVYVASFVGDSVAVFSRDPATGNLSQAADSSACVSETGSGGQCADGGGLVGAESVTVTPDGRHVYVGAVFSNTITAFARNPTTGALTQLPGAGGCVNNGGAFGCAAGSALSGLNAVTIAPGGEHAYATAENGDALSIFARFPAAVADTTRPRLSRLTLTPRTFAAGGGASIARARKVKRGTRVRYSLSEPATVTFTVRRAKRGRRAKGKCRRPTRANRGRKRCTRFVKQKGRFAHTGSAGRNSFRFTGRLRRVKLKPGRLRLVGVARDGAANRSKPIRKSFRIVRPRVRRR